MISTLEKLIKSLHPAEKRSFKLFIGRGRKNGHAMKQVILFDLIEKHGALKKQVVSKYLPELSNKHIHDLSLLLYKNILKSLLLTQHKEVDFNLRESIEFAQILYNRGLFMESLEVLGKTKKTARAHQKHFLLYEIIDFEKKIESRHVTRSHAQRAQELTVEAMALRQVMEAESKWLELSLKLYDFYLKSGHSRNANEQKQVVWLFEAHKPLTPVGHTPLFYEQLYCYQSMVWYYYITQQFDLGYKYAVKWVQLFDQFPVFKHQEQFQLLKGLHNCLSVLFFCQDLKRYHQYNHLLTVFIRENERDFDENTTLMAFIYRHLAQLNAIVLEGRFTASLPYLQQFELELNQKSDRMDHHRLMVFWYKMSTIYFTAGHHKKCIQLLNKIIHDDPRMLHEDVQAFARILNLIAHYEMGNTELIVAQVRSVYRFLRKLNEIQGVQNEIMLFLRKSINAPFDEVPLLFTDLHQRLSTLSQNKWENRAFLYLDVLSWLESKMQNKNVEEVMLKKRGVI